MKKIISILILSLIFTASINAQDKIYFGAEKSKNEALMMMKQLQITEEMSESFFALFEMKREVLENKDASLERKKEIVRIVGKKIEASLDAKQFEKLILMPELYNILTGETTLQEAIKDKK